MEDRDREQAYLDIWYRIKKHYRNGYCVSERGLQAVLYAELGNSLRTDGIIVEPRWEVNGDSVKTPDIVIVEDDCITDIFEIKFVPYHYPNMGDISKLFSYGEKSDQRYPVRINPANGKWADPVQVHNKCRLHFVAVAKYDAAAVWSDSLRNQVPVLAANPGRLNHWYGRVGSDTNDSFDWHIEFGI